MDKNPQAICLIPEDIVGTSAHDHTRTFLRQFRYDPVLNLSEVIRIVGAAIPMGKGRSQESARRILTRILDVTHMESAFLRNFLQQLTVIAGYSQRFGYFFPNGPSSAAKLNG